LAPECYGPPHGGLATVITLGPIEASPAKFLTAEGVYVISSWGKIFQLEFIPVTSKANCKYICAVFPIFSKFNENDIMPVIINQNEGMIGKEALKTDVHSSYSPAH
jgi:hypothetical protein